MRTAVLVSAIVLAATPAAADDAPRFQVDASWPQPLPNNWIMGQAAGIAVDAQDHVWVVQRPRSLTNDEKAASLNPPTLILSRTAPMAVAARRRVGLGSGAWISWESGRTSTMA